MPANLTPEYLAAEERYRKASSAEEKLEALEEMLSTIPKHKGTEKLQADIKARLAKFRKQAGTKSGPARRKEAYHIPREGAGRVVLVGAPNTGKSSLFVALTRVESEVRDYPFTTRRPVPGMMPFEDISFQLIDLPPVSAGHMESWVPQIVRLADLALLLVDVSSLDPLLQLKEPLEILKEKKIELLPAGDEAGGVEAQPSIARVRSIVAACCMDVEGAREILDLLKVEAALPMEFIPVSARTGEGLGDLGRAIFLALSIERVYSKQPGKKPSPDPFVMRRGARVSEFAGKVHRDFVERFEFARVWRRGEEKEGMKVSRDFVLLDGDIVELHM